MQDPDLIHQTSPAVVKRARRFLRDHGRLRSALYFTLNVGRILTDTPSRNRRDVLAAYAAQVDPWGWDTPWGVEHLALLNVLLAKATPAGLVDRGLDFGCGEGWLTGHLARRCKEVVAVDLSEVALTRARTRCAGVETVSFRRWDIQDGESLGCFDLVMAVCVLEVLLRPAPRRRARRRLLDMLVPGGYLVVMTTKQSAVVEGAAWSGLLARGASGIDRFLRAKGTLALVAREESASHVLTLYRRSAGDKDRRWERR